MTKNHFATLEVEPGATDEEIKKAYRKLAKKWHPDKNKDEGAEEKFKEISAAYEYLKSPDRRETHEYEVNRQKKAAPTQTNYSYSSTNGYSTKHNADNESSWSDRYGQNAENRYSQSTFGSFADEGKFSYANNHKKESKPGRKKKFTKRRSAPARSEWKPWSQDWNNMDEPDPFYDIPASSRATSRSNFSFAFRSFVDDLGVSFDTFFMDPTAAGPWEFSSFYDGTDPFAEFFAHGVFNTFGSPEGAPGMPRRPRKRDVAPEQGANGIDPEYMFTPRQSRSHTSFSNKEYTDRDTSRNLSDDDDMDSSLFKCTYCERRLPFSQLSMHEPGCALRHGGKFDEPDDDSDRYSYDGGRFGSPEEDQYPQKTGDWRQTHEELLRNIRRAKRASKNQARHREGSATTSRSTGDEGLSQVKCKWCNRSFSHPTAKHHIPFCEKWTREHGTPLNPAGKPPSRDIGSKNQRAREYAKNIQKPGDSSNDEFGADSPGRRTSKSHFDHFPDIGSPKRETMNKPAASSGTGLNASSGSSPTFSPRDKPSTTTGGIGRGMGTSTFHSRAKTTTRTAGANKFSSTTATENGSTDYSGMDDGYGFGIHGSRLKTETRTRSTGNCPVCKKRLGAHGRFSCSCGVRKTGVR